MYQAGRVGDRALHEVEVPMELARNDGREYFSMP